MRKLCLTFAFLTALPALGGPADADGDAFRRAIFFGVLEGLYEDGVATADVEMILRVEPGTKTLEHFVYGCPICSPARDAFEVYRSRTAWKYKTPRDTFGEGLDEATRTALRSEDKATRLAAIEGLVKTWVGRRLALMRLTDGERATYERRFEEMRKKGMGLLPQSALADMKRCACCDGAFGAAGGD